MVVSKVLLIQLLCNSQESLVKEKKNKTPKECQMANSTKLPPDRKHQCTSYVLSYS